ncbi:carboxymuconolactone decarboxylase family protein [Beijerinckia sp. L45]|uniref:carboxymuconolactone decarboxylase family protein n=1 Tax=Beijerinckia sp. L45 TaxID=1641855 RepID=UPI00131CA89C|nr:carboxymuconolactone decarboxylase family protein [Beijerinckia sp. L45]
MSNDHTNPIAHGVAVFGEMHPPARTAAFEAATDPATPGGRMQGLAAEFVFGQIWSDTQRLDRRARSLVTLGALIALRTGEEFSNHVRVGIANGLTRGEIEEVITHTAAYVGFPAARAAMIVAMRMFAEDVAGETGGVPAGQSF